MTMKKLAPPSWLWLILMSCVSISFRAERTLTTTSAFVIPSTTLAPSRKCQRRLEQGVINKKICRRLVANPDDSQEPKKSSKGEATTTRDEDSSSSEERMTTKKPFVNQATIQFNNKLNRMARTFDKHSAEQVENLLKQTMERIDMGLELEIEPNVVTFTAAISAWARSSHPQAAKRAEAVLNWMIDLSKSDDNLWLVDLRPNCYAYNAAIAAWIRSRDKTSHDHAERLLHQLFIAYDETKDPELKPNARSFNFVINAIARSREPKCGDRAAALLNRMEELYLAGDDDMQPDALTFGAIINAYANSGEEDSSDKAARILQEMESLYQLGYKRVKPNTFVYNACLNAFAKTAGDNDSGSNAEKATQLVELMEQQYLEKGDVSVKPDVITYSTCINAHANSKSRNAGPQSDALLKRMTDLYLLGDDSVKPNAIAYTAAIKAWMASSAAAAADAAAEDSKEEDVAMTAAKRVEEVLQIMTLQYLAGDSDQKPTKITFDLVQEAMSNVSDQVGLERLKALRKRILETKMPRRESI